VIRLEFAGQVRMVTHLSDRVKYSLFI
jgi:hypothetical protein